jgi:hypothetical protein
MADYPPKNNVARGQMDPVRRKLRLANTTLPLLTDTKQGRREPPPPQRPPLPLPPPPPPNIEGVVAYTLAILISGRNPNNRPKLAKGRVDGTPYATIWRRILEQIAAEYNTETFEVVDDPRNRVVIQDQVNNIETPLDYTQLRLLLDDPMNICVNLYRNIMEFENTDETCVPTALRNLYPSISKQKKDPIGKLKNANTTEIQKFCEDFKIRMIAFNIHGDVVAQYTPPIDTDSKSRPNHRTLAYIIYDGHLHPLDTKKGTLKYLVEVPSPSNVVVLSKDNFTSRFIEAIQQGRHSGKIKVDDLNNITAFNDEGTRYILNDQYEEVQHITSKYMFLDKVHPSTRLAYLLYDIEKLYASYRVDSFFPIAHSKTPFHYNAELIEGLPTGTIDMNKAYSYILKTLPYLLTTDIRTHEFVKTNEYKNEYYLYIAKPKVGNILMPKQDIYTGQHIKYCRGLFDFEITERLECRHHTNHYSKLVEDLYTKFSPDLAKQLVVKFIGTFESNTKRIEKFENRIVRETELNPQYPSFPVEGLDGWFVEKVATITYPTLTNRKPIALQVKDTMSRTLFEKMKDLKLQDEDVVQVKVDSITFYCSPKTPKYETSREMGKWKKAEYTPARSSIYDNPQDFETMRQRIPNNNTIVQGYAGNGKSYDIQNKLDLTDSIILSSKHSAIRQHREKGLNAQVIQKYTNNPTGILIPDEHHIVVEECGILTAEHWDLILRCIYLGKKITMYGDFDQLLPVKEFNTFSSPLFLDMFFANQIRKDENWRNKFSVGYYRSLIHSADEKYLQTQILKYSTKTYQEADIIVAYTNENVDKYNALMLKHHGKKITDVGVPLICKSNDFRKYNIYNNFILNREELPQEIDDEKIENPKYFKPAYARTLYNMQGDETKSYYFVKEDIKWFLNPRMAYTLISRLSGNITEDVKSAEIDKWNAEVKEQVEQVDETPPLPQIRRRRQGQATSSLRGVDLQPQTPSPVEA